MPRLRRLSGREVAAILRKFGFEPQQQRGSHLKLKRMGPSGKQVLTVPMHAELDTGTLRAVVRQASQFIPESDLYPHVYSE